MISGVSCFRAFIGIAVPDSVRDQLVTVENHLKQSDAHVSWVRRENLHISLAFLGNVTRDTAELLALGLDAATARSQTFSCEAVGLGAFGRPDRPRVVWAGIAPCKPLLDMQRSVTDVASQCGIPLDARPFHPHITLGRAKSSRGAPSLFRAITDYESASFGWIPVPAIALIRSELTPDGPNYNPVHVAVLPPKNGI
jgi:2'-5' RNA ligase